MTSQQPTTEDTAVVTWPRKYDVLGVKISGTTYDEAVDAIIAAAKRRARAVVSLTAVHPVVVASGDRELREQINGFDLVGPDGQPVRWALNRLYGLGLQDRVYGPEITLRICRRAAAEQLPIYLYGATPEVLEKLQKNLLKQFPELVIAGSESPPFRPLSDPEDLEMVDRVNGSGAALMFISLGAPKQDIFAAEHRDRINAVQICVGAAFDFHAGVKSVAPGWMQRNSLEWLYRLCQEPRRLWRRYLVTNSVFIAKFTRQWLATRLLPNRT